MRETAVPSPLRRTAASLDAREQPERQAIRRVAWFGLSPQLEECLLYRRFGSCFAAAGDQREFPDRYNMTVVDRPKSVSFALLDEEKQVAIC